MLTVLSSEQYDAVSKMHNGCILCGGVGSGKTRTALAYYFMQHGGIIYEGHKPMTNPSDLYIITTAATRNKHSWQKDMVSFGLSEDPESSNYTNKVVVDSWNNIRKYSDVTNAFFIFDEQRIVSWGTWAKTFIKIAKRNKWILLSATPGDKPEEFGPVLIANGYYKNKTHFSAEHLVINREKKYPVIERYVNTKKLNRLIQEILVTIDYKPPAVRHDEYVTCAYPQQLYKDITKKRWNPYKEEPIANISELCYVLRRVTNSDASRVSALFNILEKYDKIIIFYNFDYERDILLSMPLPDGFHKAEWNGHYHQSIPDSDKWIYIVQYAAGAEGWNCIETNCIVFFSQNYSYKILEQAKGRIDRRNTPFTDLYYFHLRSMSKIDIAIRRALSAKKNFNERLFGGTL